MKKYCIFQKVEKYMYKQVERSDSSMFTVFMFLGDVLGSASYHSFLQDNSRCEFQINNSYFEKKGNKVIVSIDDTIIPDLDSFITTINNLIFLVQEYKRLTRLQVDQIEITLEDDILIIKGDWLH